MAETLQEVSDSQLKIKYNRSADWKSEEIKCLINIWQSLAEDLRKPKRKQHVYPEMSKQMESSGMKRCTKEIATKIKNLTNKYRQEKGRLASGGPPSMWEYYSVINKILGRLPRNDECLIEESSSETVTDVIEESQLPADFVWLSDYVEVCVDKVTPVESTPKSEPVIKKRKINNSKNTNDYLLKEFMEDERKRDDEFKLYLKEQLDLQRGFLKVFKASLQQ